jgi:hypothetical protein
MTIGTFMPQYVVSDSLRGLCWFADNDKGWVPTQDVPATEVVRNAQETVLRFNFIGKPFKLTGNRQIVFWLMGLPARPLPGAWRVHHRCASTFGHYVGDKVMNYSPPMPRDFAKAKDFMEKGTLYDSKTFEPSGTSGKWNPDFEFAPWHDSHNPFSTPDLNPKSYEYFALEFDGSFVPTMTDLRCYQLNRYCQATALAGLYFDTPEGMGFSRNLSNGTGYIIPADQPSGGEVQPGYNIVGFREYMKRVRGLFWQNGRDNPWIEMHSTHGPIAPCTPFMDIRTEGEDFRSPTHRNFMYAWSRNHLRAIDVPPLYGMVTRWLGGYPWDGSVKGADPLRCKIGALIVHDVFSSWDRWHAPDVYGNQAPTDRQPPFGYKSPNLNEKLIALGLNREEVVFHPYWDNAGLLSVTAGGKPADRVFGSLWHIPSQDRVVVAVANWNEQPVNDIALEVQVEKLDLLPKVSGENLLVTDIETDEVLQETTHFSMGRLYFTRSGNRIPGQVKVSLPPLDFKLFLFTKQ